MRRSCELSLLRPRLMRRRTVRTERRERRMTTIWASCRYHTSSSCSLQSSHHLASSLAHLHPALRLLVPPDVLPLDHRLPETVENLLLGEPLRPLISQIAHFNQTSRPNNQVLSPIHLHPKTISLRTYNHLSSTNTQAPKRAPIFICRHYNCQT